MEESGVFAFVANKPVGVEAEQLQALYIETTDADAGLGVDEAVVFAGAIDRLAKACYAASHAAVMSHCA